jgi:steroid delta-isomerase-like uncharacterized protein
VADQEFVRWFAQQWVDAWNAHDGARLLELCTEDTVWEDPAVPEPIGRAEVPRFLEETWSMFPDLRFETPEPALAAVHGDSGALVWRLLGTMLGDSPQGFAPTGKQVDVPGIDLYDFRDGKLKRYRTLYDVTTLGRQMGLVPPAGHPSEKVLVKVQRLRMKLKRR